MTDIFDLNEKPEEQDIADVVVNAKEITKIDSTYRLILLTAQRAKQIQRGARPRVDMDARTVKPTTIARAEFDEDKVMFEITKET